MTFSTPFSVSLLALKKDEAVIILCYAMLEGNCLSSVVTQAWKEMEERVLGFGDLVKMLMSTFDPPLCALPAVLATMLQWPEPISTVLSGATSWEKLIWVTREASSKKGIWEFLSLLFSPLTPPCIHPRCVTASGGITWTRALTVLSAH